MKRSALAARCMVVALLVTACGGGTTTEPEGTAAAATTASPAVPDVPGIRAEAVVLRTDDAVGGQFQVHITNTGDAPFTVTEVTLESPGFAELPPTEKSAEYAPGRTIDLRTPLGEPICSGEAEPAVARLTMSRPGAAPQQVRVPLAAEALVRVHDRECAVLAVTEVVDIAVANLRATGGGVSGDLTLTRRRGEAPVTVTSASGSVLIDVAADDLPLSLGPGDRQGSTPVTFVPATCEPHVLAETKKPYAFPMRVEVGEDDPAVVNLPISDGLRAGLVALVDRVC
jgi:hypothetical protein